MNVGNDPTIMYFIGIIIGLILGYYLRYISVLMGTKYKLLKKSS